MSYHNIRALHKKIDSVPARAGKWATRHLSFPDRPDEKYTIRYRNPVEAIKSLWGDPELASHLVYRPKKIFTDETRSKRIYSEMWTGKWWHAIQVRFCLITLIMSFHKY